MNILRLLVILMLVVGPTSAMAVPGVSASQDPGPDPDPDPDPGPSNDPDSNDSPAERERVTRQQSPSNFISKRDCGGFWKRRPCDIISQDAILPDDTGK